MDKTLKSEKEAVSAKELKEILSSYEVFSNLPDTVYESLAAVAERVFVPAGQRILSYGEQAEWAFIIESGRLKAVIPLQAIVPGSDRTITEELGRGECSALVAALTREPVKGDLFAVRDSRIIRIRGTDMLRCMTAHPELIVAYSLYIVDMAERTHGKNAPMSRPQAFALLPAHEDPSIRETADELYEALSTIVGPGSLNDSRRLEEHFGRGVYDAAEFERIRPRLTAWCESQEAEGNFLLFLCDPTDTSWTRWCLQQTDRIVVVARAGDTAEIERIDRMFAARMVAGSTVKVDLLLVHDRDTEMPSGMLDWMKLECRRRHHHVRSGNTADFQRAARRMSERAVGVVLGGGGARGLAHIGVLKALEEAGIPVDVIGGTSMGSVIAAAYARGWSPERLLKMAGEVFTNSRAVMDLDFPMVSILGGGKLNRALQSIFEDIDIADLWLPYYCISSSLSDGHMVVHDRGPLWQKVRASCSLPGIFPPVYTEGQLLVDGGIVNNVPMDVMGRQCAGGTVIAVDVGGGGARDFMQGDPKQTSGWSLLLNRLNPTSPNDQIANIFQILIWSTTLSSRQYLRNLVESGRVDLFLTPPVQKFQLLGFDAYEKLYKIGYEYTREKLAEWNGLQQVVTGKMCGG